MFGFSAIEMNIELLLKVGRFPVLGIFAKRQLRTQVCRSVKIKY